MQDVLASLVEVLARSGRALLGLAPYVVVGVLASEALKLARLTGLVRQGCERSLASAIGLAAALGIASPLCTYGTIPLVLGLLTEGVPLAPLVTFLSTSSLMNPQLFVMTLGGLGTEMALVRLLAVALFGLLLGAAVHGLPVRWLIGGRTLRRSANEHDADTVNTTSTTVTDGHGGHRHTVEVCGRHGPEPGPEPGPGPGPGPMPMPLPLSRPTPRPRPRPRLSAASFARGTLHGLELVGYYFVVGVLLGAVIEVFVPGRWISRVFSTGGWISVLLATALGVPLYACGGGAIPLVRSAMRQGMSKGAALSFLIVGPATRVTPILSLTALLKPVVVLLYVLAVFGFSTISGLLYQLYAGR